VSVFSITNGVTKRISDQDKLANVFQILNAVDISGVLEKNLNISKDNALLLLSSRKTFNGIVTLKFCLDHVPKTFCGAKRDRCTHLFSFVADTMRKKGFMLSPLSPPLLCPSCHFVAVVPRYFRTQDIVPCRSLPTGVPQLRAQMPYKFGRPGVLLVFLCMFFKMTLSCQADCCQALSHPFVRLVGDCTFHIRQEQYPNSPLL